MPGVYSLDGPGDHRVAVIALWALVVGCAGCWHDWDDYEAPESNDSPGELCSDLCDAHKECIREIPDCLTNCAAQAVNCSQAQMIQLRECVDELESCDVPAVAETIWRACLLQVGCYTPP